MITGHKIVIDLTKDIWYGEDNPVTTSINEGIYCVADGVKLISAVCVIDKICMSDLVNPNPALTIQSGRFNATLTFASDLIPENTAFWFTLKNVKNAPFIRPITVSSLKTIDKGDETII